jgi:hypothetical protein
MKNQERIIISSILALLAFAWLGFLFHVSPRFAGSRLGAVFGILGAVLMLLPLVYVAAKRIPFLRRSLTKRLSMQTWLSVHIYTGILGALFALIHTGHKYESWLGIVLTATMLLVVLSGYVLRYLTPFVNRDKREKLLLLQTARGDLDNAWGVLEKAQGKRGARPRVSWMTGMLAAFGLLPSFDAPAARVVSLADGVADLEYSIRTHDLLLRWFSISLIAHIVLSVAMYALLGAHIAAGIYFGLRWFE